MDSVVYETNIPDGALSGSAIALKPAGGTTANQQLLIYPTANDGDHIHLTSGNLYATELFLGSDNFYVKLANTGNVVVNSNDDTGNTAQWIFGTDGRLINLEGLTLTAGGQFNICTILTGGSGYDTGSALKATTGGSGTGMTVGIGYGLSNQLTNADVVDPGTGYVDGDVITVSGGTGGTFVITQYNDQANQGNNNFIESNWTFGAAGNLTLPGNIIAINYANGNRVTGNITFRDEIVIGTGTSNLISGLYLAPSSSSADANMYLRVRGNVNDEPTHIHFDTGNNQYYNQFIGDDNKYIQLANTGNIVINSNDNAGNTAQWIFNTAGTLALPGGSRIRPLGANLDLFAGTGSYVNLITADESSSMGVAGSGGYVTTAGGTWNFGSTGNLTAPGNVSAVGNIIGGNIVTSGNITTAGSGGDIVLTGGNITGANNISANTFSASGNVTAGGLTVNGAGVVTGNLQIQGNLTYNNLTNITTANLVFGLANTTTGISANGAGFVVGNTAEASFLYNYTAQSWDSNIGISAVGNVAGGNLRTAGLISATGNVTAGNVSATNITGTLATAAQTNITSVGTLSGLSVTANVTGGNILTGGIVSSTGNVTGNYIIGNGSQLTGVTAYTNANVSTFLAAFGSNTISTTGSITSGNVTGGNVLTGGIVSATGNITGGNIRTVGLISSTGNITGGNISATNHTGTTVSVAGNITGGNVLTGGVVSATGNITGGNISATNHTGTTVSVTGNVTGGNITTAGQISATGNITTANSFVGNLTGTTVSVTGNVSAGNVIVNGQPTTYGVVHPDYIQAEN